MDFGLGDSFSRWHEARDLEGDRHLECVAGRESVTRLRKISGPNLWLLKLRHLIGFKSAERMVESRQMILDG